MSNVSVKLVNPKSKRERSLAEQHMVGEKVARTELAGFMNYLIKKHNLSKVELAGALISIAYGLLRSGRPAIQANSMFRKLASETQKLFDFKKDDNVQ
tara:strand:+ start:3503 stop:3796 length:294 start_codon:yes stop_codon:yes gene_type:complete